jgi:hypothetical protein
LGVLLDLLAPAYFPLLDADKFESHKMHNQRVEFLMCAKSLLQSSDPSLIEISDGTIRGGILALLGRSGVDDVKPAKSGKEGVDEAFCLSKFMVSNQVYNLSEEIYRRMETLKSRDQNNQHIIWSVRDCICIFRAITG